MVSKKAFIWTDGAARGNPGPAAIGAVIKDEAGIIRARISRCIGSTTNNQAEYRAVIAALEKSAALGATEVSLNCDSELIIRQLTGRYRVRNAALKGLFEEVRSRLGRFERVTLNCIPRAENAAADALANKALDG